MERVDARELRRCRSGLIEAGDLRPGRGQPLDAPAVNLPPGSPTSAQSVDELRDEG